MKHATEAILVGLAAFAALMGAAFAQDSLFRLHSWIVFGVLLISTIVLLRRVKAIPESVGASILKPDSETEYMDGPIRYGVIATMFWGVVGFLVGVGVASQLAWPDLNIEPWLNFGRTRPLHTSAVVFAFGGNALLATSFYVVQRTTRARLFGGDLAWFVFWGYQLFIVMAATMPNLNGMSTSGSRSSGSPTCSCSSARC
jgi:cytochrome c oxidase cbb3-type subunit I